MKDTITFKVTMKRLQLSIGATAKCIESAIIRAESLRGDPNFDADSIHVTRIVRTPKVSKRHVGTHHDV